MSTTLTAADFARAAKNLNVEIAAIRAVAEVEAAGAGFLPDGRPAILYEAHVFHKETGGKHAGATAWDLAGTRFADSFSPKSPFAHGGAAN